MASKTALAEAVKAFRWKEVKAAFEETPALRAYRDPRGRNWLHLCCATNPAQGGRKASDSVKTAELLLKEGFDIDEPAFTEGAWKATPLWFAVGRGENPQLVQTLLRRGADPNHCLWAAGYRSDLLSIKRLVAAGADIDAIAEGETPFLAAIKSSHFDVAKLLLKLGANPNVRDAKGTTALHYMLKKSSGLPHFEMLVRRGARGDIRDAAGVTAIEIMKRKRSPGFTQLAERLERREPEERREPKKGR